MRFHYLIAPLNPDRSQLCFLSISIMVTRRSTNVARACSWSRATSRVLQKRKKIELAACKTLARARVLVIAFISRHDCVKTQLLLFFLYLIGHIIGCRCYLRRLLGTPCDTHT